MVDCHKISLLLLNPDRGLLVFEPVTEADLLNATFRSKQNAVELRDTESLKVDNMFEIDFIASNQSRTIQLQFATNRIKIGLLEPEIQLAKGEQRHYAGPMTSRDVIGLPPVTVSLATLYNCYLIVEDYTKDT